MKDFSALYNEAHSAGLEALNRCRPTPMVVGQAKSLFSDELDYTKETYVVNEGVCGFAWVNVKPGNSAFAKWLKANDYGRTDSYYGGVTVWVREGDQSYELKRAYAGAFAKVLTENGIRAYSDGRLD